MRPEQALYNLIKDHLPGHHQRIESIAGVGAPDVELCYEGKSCWIELKCPPKRDMDIWDMLRPSQQIWHLKRYKQFGKVFVLYRYENTVVLERLVGKGFATSDPHREYCLYIRVWSESKPWPWENFTASLIGAL